MEIFSNLALYFLFIFLTFISIFGFGRLINIAIQIHDNEYYFLHYEFIVGLIFVSFISMFFNLFFPLFDFYNFLLFLIGLVLFFFLKNNKKILTFVFLSLLAFFISIFAGLNDDIVYHLNTIKNYKNLTLFEIDHERRVSYNSNWLFISSIFSFEKYLYGLFVPVSLLYSIVIYDLFNAKKIAEKNINHPLSIFSLFSIVFIIGVINNLKDFGTDVPGFLLLILIMMNILYYNFDENKSDYQKKLFLLFLFCNFAFMIKITNSLVFLYFVVFILSYNLKLLSFFNFRNILALLPLFLWFLQNFIISGCIIWPIKTLCFYEFGDAKKELYLIESFAKGDINVSINVDGFKWISTWISSHSSKILEIYGVYFLVLIIPNLYFYFYKKNTFNVSSIYKNFYYKNKNLLYLFIITIICNLIWFLYYPAYRFGLFYNLVFIYFILLPFWQYIILNKTLNIFFSRSLILIAILFFIYENLEKINDHKNKYGNIWPSIDSNYQIIHK